MYTHAWGRTALLALASALLVAVLPAAPSQATVDGYATVVGKVTDERGVGIPEVQVLVLYPTDMGWYVLSSSPTQSDGTYEIYSVPAGTHRVAFGAHPKYDVEYYPNAYRVEDAQDVEMADGEVIVLNASLRDSTQITGQVTSDTFGVAPYPDVDLLLMEEGRISRRTTVTGDEQGRYAFYSIQPGRYRIEFEQNSHAWEYWNDATDIELASELVVSANEVVRMPDVELRWIPRLLRYTVAPAITGTPQVGRGLVASRGEWDIEGGQFSYQWFRGKAPIAGAKGLRYTPGPDDVGARLRFVATQQVPYWSRTSALSSATTPVARGELRARRELTLKGAARVGAALVVRGGNWVPAPATVSYRWFAGSRLIKSATGKGLTLTKELVGQTIKVIVRASRPGYRPAAATLKSRNAVSG